MSKSLGLRSLFKSSILSFITLEFPLRGRSEVAVFGVSEAVK